MEDFHGEEGVLQMAYKCKFCRIMNFFKNLKRLILFAQIYVLCRLMTLAFVITNLVALNVTTPINCNVRLV